MRKFLIPVTAAISALLGQQANAKPAPTEPTPPTDATSNEASRQSARKLPVYSGGDEYGFILERKEAGVIMAQHRSHSSHSSHRSHYSSR